jgi:hypothetical protein
MGGANALTLIGGGFQVEPGTSRVLVHEHMGQFHVCYRTKPTETWAEVIASCKYKSHAEDLRVIVHAEASRKTSKFTDEELIGRGMIALRGLDLSAITQADKARVAQVWIGYNALDRVQVLFREKVDAWLDASRTLLSKEVKLIPPMEWGKPLTRWSKFCKERFDRLDAILAPTRVKEEKDDV